MECLQGLNTCHAKASRKHLGWGISLSKKRTAGPVQMGVQRGIAHLPGVCGCPSQSISQSFSL